MNWFGSSTATGVTGALSSWLQNYVPKAVQDLVITTVREIEPSMIAPAASLVVLPYTAYSAYSAYKSHDRAYALHSAALSVLSGLFAATKPFKELAPVAITLGGVYLGLWFVGSNCCAKKRIADGELRRFTNEFAQIARAAVEEADDKQYSYMCHACSRPTNHHLTSIRCDKCYHSGYPRKEGGSVVI